MEKSAEDWKIRREKKRGLQEALEIMMENKTDIPALYSRARNHINDAEFSLEHEDCKKAEAHLEIAMALLEEIKVLRLF